MLNQSGTTANGNGIVLSSIATDALKLTAGTNNSVTLKTNNQNLSLGSADNFQVEGGTLRIDLGSAKMVSAYGTIPPGGYTINAKNMNVNYTGATSGNNAKIDIGSNGSFTLVGVDSSGTVSLPTAVSLSSMGVVRNGVAATGNSLVGFESTSATALAINGGANWTNSAIKYLQSNAGFVITGTNSFTDNLTLVTNGGAINFGGSIAVGSNKTLTLNTGGGDLTVSAASTVTGGNNLVIDLGSGNFVANATLTATGINTTLTAAAITGTATKALDLGSGRFTALTRSAANITLNNTGNGLGGLTLLDPGTKVTAGSINYSLITTGTVTINGVDRTNASNLAAKLTNITGSKISVVGATNSFANDLTLESSNGNIDLNGNIAMAGNNALTLNTNGNNLNLSGNSSVTGGLELNLNLGAGAITGGNTLTANGFNVYYIGSSTANDATINAANFYTSITKDGNYTLSLTDLPTNMVPTGLSVNAKLVRKISVNGDITVSGIDASANNYRLTLSGSKITVTGSNKFGGDVYLSSSTGGMNLQDSIQIGNGKTLNLNTSNRDVTLSDNFTVTGGATLRLKLGAGIILGNKTLNATGFNVLYTGAKANNNATIDVGKGQFIYVTDRSNVTDPTVLTKDTLASDATIGWNTTGFGSWTTATGGFSAGGLTVETLGTQSTVNGYGVVYGGTVDIQGITATSAVGKLSYIEGKGIAVTASESKFAGSLTLVSIGSGTSVGGNGVMGIDIEQDLTIGGTGNLDLIQSGNVAEHGIILNGVSVTAGGAITLTQSGSAGKKGIYLTGATLSAEGDIALRQIGTVGSGFSGIDLNAAGVTALDKVALMAGANNSVILKTNNHELSLTGADNIEVTRGKVRIDLGTGNIKGGKTLKATDLFVLYTGATAGNNATIEVGNGQFVYVTDFSNDTKATTLKGDTVANWNSTGFGINNWTKGTVANGVTPFTAGGLTVKTLGAASSVNGVGVIYGGTVDIQGITAASAVGKLNYIEGTGISVTGATDNNFAASLTLVSSGSGVTINSWGIGIFIKKNLTIGTPDDGTSNITLIQSGKVQGYGIMVTEWNASTRTTLTSGGAMNFIQTGSTAENSGISVYGSSLTSGGAMTLAQSGSAGSTGISVYGATLTSAGDILLNQSGTVGSGEDGILFGTGGGVSQKFIAGANNSVTFKTNNQNLNLSNNDNFHVSGGTLRIDLGTGKLTSSLAAGYTLKATGLDVYYTGAGSGNKATINVGNGRFYNTVGKSGDYTLVAGDFPTNTAPGGLTVTSSNLIGAAVMTDGKLTVNGVDASSRVYPLALFGGNIIVSGTNKFGGDLNLLSSTGTIDLAGSIQLGNNGALNFNSNDNDLNISGNITLTAFTGNGTINFNLGTGNLSGAGSLTAAGFTAKWLSGAGITNSPGIALELGGGKFYNITNVTGDVTLDNNAVGGGIHTTNNPTAISLVDLSTASLAKVNATGGIITGLIVDGIVTINGVEKTSLAGGLKHITGNAIKVTGSASNFAGSLNLVATGGVNSVGIVIEKNLAIGTDAASHLSLTGSGTVNGAVGISISNATVTAGGNITLLQNKNDYSIRFDNATLKAGRSIDVTSVGPSGVNSLGISLKGSNFIAGRGRFVSFATNNANLQVDASNNSSIFQGNAKINLGSGNFEGTAANATLKTYGGDVYFANSGTNKNIGIDLGGGTFYDTIFSTDSTTSISGNQTLASLGTYFKAAPDNHSITLSNSAGTNAAFVTTGAVAISGLSYTVNSPYAIVGGRITVSGTNDVGGNLNLTSTNWTIDLGGTINLAKNGQLSLNTGGKDLNISAATSVTSSNDAGKIIFNLVEGNVTGSKGLTASGLSGIWQSGGSINNNSGGTALDFGSGTFTLQTKISGDASLATSAGGLVYKDATGRPDIVITTISEADLLKVTATGGKTYSLVDYGTLNIAGITAGGTDLYKKFTNIQANKVVLSNSNNFAGNLSVKSTVGDVSFGNTSTDLVTVGGNLSLNSAAKINLGREILLGSGGNLSLSTANGDVVLGSNVKLTASSGTGKITIDLGSGKFKAESFKLSASAFDVYWVSGAQITGGVTNNGATTAIELGSGSFKNVTNYGFDVTLGATVKNTTTAELLTPTLLAVTSTQLVQAATLQTGITSTGKITLDGVTIASNIANANYLKGATIEAKGNNKFAGAISIIAGANPSAGGQAITLTGRTAGDGDGITTNGALLFSTEGGTIYIDGAFKLDAGSAANLISLSATDKFTNGTTLQGGVKFNGSNSNTKLTFADHAVNNASAATFNITTLNFDYGSATQAVMEIDHGHLTISGGGLDTTTNSAIGDIFIGANAATAAAAATPSVNIINTGGVANGQNVWSDAPTVIFDETKVSKESDGTITLATEINASGNIIIAGLGTSASRSSASKITTGSGKYVKFTNGNSYFAGNLSIVSGSDIVSQAPADDPTNFAKIFIGAENKGDLKLSANGGVKLFGEFGSLSEYSQGSKGGYLNLTSNHSLTIIGAINNGSLKNGAVGAGAFDVNITVTGDGNLLTLRNDMTGGTVRLTSSGGINGGTALGTGFVNAKNLDITANGNVTVSGAITSLDKYEQGLTGGDFSLTSSTTLALATAIANGNHKLTIAANGNIAGLTLSQDMSGSIVSLTSAGGITGGSMSGSGLVIAGTSLNLTVSGAVTLQGTFASLTGFKQNSTIASDGDLSLNSSSQTLTIAGTLDNKSNKIKLSANNIALNGDIKGSDVALKSTTQISTGIKTPATGSQPDILYGITATNLSIVANGNVTVNGAISNLSEYKNGVNFGENGGDLSLTSSAKLTLGVEILNKTHNVTIAANGNSDPNGFALTKDIFGGIVTLISAGKMTGGTSAGNGFINATSLNLAAKGAVSVAGSIDRLAGFTQNSTASSGADFSLSSTRALTIAATVNNGGHNITVTTTGETIIPAVPPGPGNPGGTPQSTLPNGITLAGDMTTTGTGSITLISAGTITTSIKQNIPDAPVYYSINTSQLNITANGDVTVNGAIGKLSGYTQGATGGNLRLTSSVALNVAAAVNNPTKYIYIKANGITFANNITAGTLGLISGSGIAMANIAGTNTKASLNIEKLYINAAGDVAVAGAIGEIISLTQTAGNFVLTSSKALTVSGNLSNTGNLLLNSGKISLTTIGNGITFTGAGGITANMAALTSDDGITASGITVTTLSLSAANDMTIAGEISNLTSYTQTLGNFNLTSSKTLTIAVAINNGTRNITMTTTGAGSNINIARQVTGGILELNSSGGINQLAGGSVNVAYLRGSANGTVSIIGNVSKGLQDFSVNKGDFTFTSYATLAIGGTLSIANGTMKLVAPTISLTSATNFTRIGGLANLTLSGPVQGNGNMLNIGTNTQRFSQINFEGSLTNLGVTEIYGYTELNWSKSSLIINAGNDSLTAPRYSSKSNNQLITIATLDAPIVNNTITSVVNNLNKNQSINIQIPTVNNKSQVINVENSGEKSSGDAKGANTSSKKSDRSSDSTGDTDSNAQTNVGVSSTVSTNPNLSLIYSVYAPLVRLSDDLSDNYLFPMSGNPDLWVGPATAENEQRQ